ncbi:triggering receptor expressed on myeloid cells 2-like isoform X2 [Hemicordylus capensis]|uniref:triggering receptor expressed on myeloid cells 2-like isoform X2 n=1 Tax=Hemicordylus capensis TaxID=884348 RepID=UPI002303FDCD|nr:triggering receptor expressed on myeloid cells 2-like isoform X2 [Hemicordylus capensis]
MEKFVHFIFFVSLSEMYTMENVTVVHGVEGEPISINCTYSPKENQWKEKSWCKHISTVECQHIVSARRFWMPFLKRRNGTTSIADNIQKGILTVTINPLQKQDSGLYQCKTEFLGTMNTLHKVKVKVLTGIEETEAPEKPRVRHSISSSPSEAGINLCFLVAGFLSFKLLVAVLILIVARSKKSRTEEQDGITGQNEHELFPITE